MLEKTLESPLNCKEIQPVHPKGDQSWVFTGRTDVEAETLILWHPAYLTYMQSTSGEMPSWMKHKLESRLLGEISITSDMQMTPPLWQKEKKN